MFAGEAARGDRKAAMAIGMMAMKIETARRTNLDALET
jgi:hypothetical protein